MILRSVVCVPSLVLTVTIHCMQGLVIIDFSGVERGRGRSLATHAY